MNRGRRQLVKDPKVAVAYIRVSTEDQNLGPEAQRASIERWAHQNGIVVAAWHEDRLSGATAVEDRPGLLAALGSLKEHESRPGLLLAAKRDRIARDVLVAAVVERLAQQAGARVATADGVSADDTPEAQLFRTIQDAFAAYERALIRSRTKAALAVKRGHGQRISGRAPLGYRFEAGRLVEDASERAILNRVEGMRDRGLSFDRIVSVLNAEGPRCRGGRWHATTLKRALAAQASRKAA
jgi:DNA invertase Pin-like site-specific DNA recombinase